MQLPIPPDSSHFKVTQSQDMISITWMKSLCLINKLSSGFVHLVLLFIWIAYGAFAIIASTMEVTGIYEKIYLPDSILLWVLFVILSLIYCTGILYFIYFILSVIWHARPEKLTLHPCEITYDTGRMNDPALFESIYKSGTKKINQRERITLTREQLGDILKSHPRDIIVTANNKKIEITRTLIDRDKLWLRKVIESWISESK